MFGCRVLQTQEKRIHFHLYLAMLVQVGGGGDTWPGDGAPGHLLGPAGDQAVGGAGGGGGGGARGPRGGGSPCLPRPRGEQHVRGEQVPHHQVEHQCTPRYEAPLPAPLVDERYRGIGNMVTLLTLSHFIIDA